MWAFEHQAAAAAAADLAYQPQRLAALHLGAEAGVAAQLGEVYLPFVGAQAVRAHQAGRRLLGGGLLAVQRANGDEGVQIAEQRDRVDLGERALLDRAQAGRGHASSRSTGLVRQVGPPSALKDSGAPGNVKTVQPASSRSRLVTGL